MLLYFCPLIQNHIGHIQPPINEITQMRKFILNKVPSVESMEIQAELPVANDVVETTESTEPVVDVSEIKPLAAEESSDDPLIEGDEEITEYSDGCDELCDTVAALESLVLNIEASLNKGGLTNQDIQYATGHANYLTQRIGLESFSIGLESSTTRIQRTEVALEDLKETLNKALKAVLEFLARMWEAAIKFITGLSRHARELKKKFLSLKGMDFDYDVEVISKVGNKGKLFGKNGKPNPNAVKDAEKFVAAFYSSKYSANVVNFKLIGKAYIGLQIGAKDIVRAMVDHFPMFLENEPAQSVDEYGGVKEFVWQSPIEAFKIRAVVPDKSKLQELMAGSEYKKCGYFPIFDLNHVEISGSLKDLGITNVDALIPRLVAAVDEFEKKSNSWENSVTMNKAGQAVFKSMLIREAQSFVAQTLAPLGRCVVEPMRGMANVSYQMLYALEEMFRVASTSEKEVKQAD